MTARDDRSSSPPGIGIETKFSASARRLPNAHSPSSSVFLVREEPRMSPRQHQLTTDIRPLELNPMTHYYETPFELAVEHFQNQAV